MGGIECKSEEDYFPVFDNIGSIYGCTPHVTKFWGTTIEISLDVTEERKQEILEEVYNQINELFTKHISKLQITGLLCKPMLMGLVNLKKTNYSRQMLLIYFDSILSKEEIDTIMEFKGCKEEGEVPQADFIYEK